MRYHDGTRRGPCYNRKRPACTYVGGASILGVVPMYQILLAELQLATAVINLLTSVINLLAALINRRSERGDPTANSTIAGPGAKHFRQK